MGKNNTIRRGIIQLAVGISLLVLLVFLWILLIQETIGTTFGTILLVVVGVSLMIFGTFVLIGGIRDLIRALRS